MGGKLATYVWTAILIMTASTASAYELVYCDPTVDPNECECQGTCDVAEIDDLVTTDQPALVRTLTGISTDLKTRDGSYDPNEGICSGR